MNSEQLETAKAAYVAANYNRAVAEQNLYLTGWQDSSSLKAALDKVEREVKKPQAPAVVSDEADVTRGVEGIEFVF